MEKFKLKSTYKSPKELEFIVPNQQNKQSSNEK